MHTIGDNTSFCTSKPLGATERAFSTLVTATHTLCAAERDIAGLVAGDPAFDAWFRDAEAARAAVLVATDGVIRAMTMTATDRRFRAVALNFEAMLVTSDARKYALLSEALTSSAWLYTIAGRGPRAARATALLQTFRTYLGVLQGFPDYTPEPPAPAMAMAA